jgi:RHS repeat-associated protein
LAEYGYNALDLRIYRRDGEGAETHYVFDLAGNRIEEHTEGESDYYVWRNGRHLARVTGEGERYFYATDHLGTTVAMTNEAGEVVWSGKTTPFGEQVDEAGALAETEDLKYTGKDRDPATGLYYFNARWYDAAIGRFTTEDPARDGGNWYLYVGANPLSFVDPSGLELVTATAAVSTGTVVAVGAAATWSWLMLTSDEFRETNVRFGEFVGEQVGNVVRGVWDGASDLFGRIFQNENTSDGDAGEASEAAANAGSAAQPRTPEDLVEDDATVRNETGRGTRHKDDVSRPGGAAAAEEEFDEIVVPDSIQHHPNGVRTGSTPDGRRVVLYPESSSGSGRAPTIRINRPGSSVAAQIKIRYPEGME